MARSKEVWNKKFKVVLGCFGLMEKLSKEDDLIEYASTMFRNPIVFDNNKMEVKQTLAYKVQDFDKLEKSDLTEDHLIGTSNMVLYMFKNELYKKWRDVEDFKKTLKALNVLLLVTKSLNNKNVVVFKIENKVMATCFIYNRLLYFCLLYTSPSPRDPT